MTALVKIELMTNTYNNLCSNVGWTIAFKLRVRGGRLCVNAFLSSATVEAVLEIKGILFEYNSNDIIERA